MGRKKSSNKKHKPHKQNKNKNPPPISQTDKHENLPIKTELSPNKQPIPLPPPNSPILTQATTPTTQTITPAIAQTTQTTTPTTTQIPPIPPTSQPQITRLIPSEFLHSSIIDYTKLTPEDMDKIQPIPKLPIIDFSRANLENPRIARAIFEEFRILTQPLRDKNIMMLLEKILRFVSMEHKLIVIGKFNDWCEKLFNIIQGEVSRKNISDMINMDSTERPPIIFVKNYYVMFQQILEKHEIILFMQLYCIYTEHLLKYYDELVKAFSTLIAIKYEQLEYSFGLVFAKLSTAMNQRAILADLQMNLVYDLLKDKVKAQIEDTSISAELSTKLYEEEVNNVVDSITKIALSKT